VSVIFVNQSSVHYESLGRGRPVIFLHSWIGSWRYWVPAMQHASVSHSSYALDLLGFGDTSRDPSGYSLETQALMLQGFLDEMGIERIALVGHGLGAIVGLLFAGREPARVDRILGVALPLDPAAVNGTIQSASPEELLGFLAGRVAGAEELRTSPAAVDPRAVRAAIYSDQLHAALGAVQEAAIPCLLIYGADDPLLPLPMPDLTTSVGANVHQIILEESGHFPMLDAADTFNRLLIDFLALERGVSPRGIKPREEWRRRMR
jgi:pimeloyl-ACP methyl ester carboxylesterase